MCPEWKPFVLFRLMQTTALCLLKQNIVAIILRNNNVVIEFKRIQLRQRNHFCLGGSFQQRLTIS